LGSILAWYTDRVRAIAWFAHGRLGPGQASNLLEQAGASGEAADLPRYSYDASLLFRRMAALEIDRDQLARDDPLLFRELQALCTLCRDKERCVLDLAQEGDKPDNREWREYCTNATTLNALGAVQNCARAAQYLRTPRSTDYVALAPTGRSADAPQTNVNVYGGQCRGRQLKP
jgi:hypothetical protein